MATKFAWRPSEPRALAKNGGKWRTFTEIWFDEPDSHENSQWAPVNTKTAFITSLLGALSACGTGSDLPPGSESSAGSTSGAGTGTAGTVSSGGANGGAPASGGAGMSSGGLGGAAPIISGPPAAGSVFVHLFEWKWTDIATECERYLGPAGFAAVQVSPPSEHALLSGSPWYERYQTVNYSLTQSRSGTEAEFKDMVQRCARVGVGIYVDAVVNHMTAQSVGQGSNGTKFTKYEYAGLYTATDFHKPTCAIANTDYADNAAHVQSCELVGLADLDTSSDTVRDKIAGYLNALVDLGVAGFRIDAAKHMAPADLDAIVTHVNQHATEKKPFIFLEVIDNGNEAVKASDYLTVGMASGQAASITDFQYAGSFERFLGYSTLNVSQFRTLKADSGNLLPSARAVVFTTNHDTERQEAIYYRDGKSYELATVFLLAAPYGYPSLMSSFSFERGAVGNGSGPPADAQGKTTRVYAPGSETPSCAADTANPALHTWVCQHRAAFVAPMVAFRKAVAGTGIANFWDNGGNQVAFSRGDQGFVAINREATALSHAFSTGLAAGNYCDVIVGGLKNGACAGTTVTVDATGMATLELPAMTALAIQVGQKQP